MSHNIQHFDYPDNVDKKKVCADLDNYVAHEDWQEGCSGLCNPIRWIDKVFETHKEAVDYIDKIDQGWYDNIAVKYKEYPRPDKSKLNKYEELCTKAQAARKEYNDFAAYNHFKDVKAAFIGCPVCKSKINREIYTTKSCYVQANYCPVCREDMRSDTMKKKLIAMKSKWDKLSNQAQEELDKQKKKNKPETRWVVKIEYHT